MRARLEGMMKAYGQQLTLIRRDSGETAEVRAFLQPLLKQNERLPVTATPLGAVDDRRWLYVGPAALELKPGDEIRFRKEHFVAQEAMIVCFQQSALYDRAVLRRKKEVTE